MFHFIEQLTNAISWDDVETENEVNEIDNTMDILSFYLRGYHDIMDIFATSSQLNVYHNDFHEGNILINKNDNYRWYLIDFGDIFYDTAYDWYNEKYNAEFKCVAHSCPPSTRYHLETLEKRKQFRMEYTTKYGDYKLCQNELSKMAKYSKRYELISIMFHGFIHSYCMLNKTMYIHYNHSVCHKLVKWNEEMRLFRNRFNRDGVDFSDDQIYINRWCIRQKMIKLLKQNDCNLQKVRNDKMKQEFWNLLNIFQDDLKYLNQTNF